jgi:hypothetical protein
MKSVVIALLTTALLLVVISPALAIPPVVETFEFHSVLVHDCGSFTFTLDDNVTGRETLFFNSDGSIDRYQLHLRFQGTLTHSGTGQSYKDHASLFFTGTPPWEGTDSDKRSGVFIHTTIPGHGVVALLVGRVIFDENGIPVFEAGPTSITSTGLEFICESLAGL